MSETPDGASAPTWYDAATPEVSIVVLNYNKPDLTKTCLAHLWANTSGKRYEIVVVDNGSSPANYEALRGEHPGPFRLLRLAVNRYFGEGNNIGAEAARGAHVVFLNNDAFVALGWLGPLVRRLEADPLCGGVGPLFVYPDGRVQEAGAFVGADGRAVQVGKYHAQDATDVTRDHVVDYCSAACFLMRRDLFLEVGGFEYLYEPAYYEDVDLCLKIAAAGRHVAYCAGSRVVHVENATSSEHSEALGLGTIVAVNRTLLLGKWGDHLAARDRAALGRDGVGEPNGAEAPRAAARRARGAARPRAVFYTPYDITPGGGERYLLTAAAALLEDFDVHLATEETYSAVRLRGIGRDLSIDLTGLELVERRELGRLGAIDLGVVMANEALPPLPGLGLANLYVCQFPFPQSRADVLRRLGNLDGFDETLVYSPFVRGHLLAERRSLGLGGRPVGVIAPPVPQAPAGFRAAPLAPPYRVVLIGRFFAGGHNKRHDVAIEAVRRLNADGLPVALDLVGSLSPRPEHRAYYAALVALARGLPVTFHPNASPEALAALLAAGHIYVHAAGYEVDADRAPHECEHFGISVLEAMSHGLAPFVVANGGPATFVRDGDNGRTYAGLDELVGKVAAALADPEGLERTRAAAAASAAAFGERAFADAWRARAAALVAG